ncbi:MAG: hypothetical protein WBB74_04960 [Gaiellaceae bacterium]
MSATILRPRPSERARESRSGRDVEQLTECHEVLVSERQQLRAAAADETALEQNRLAIVRCQWELSHALIARHLPAAAAAA